MVETVLYLFSFNKLFDQQDFPSGIYILFIPAQRKMILEIFSCKKPPDLLPVGLTGGLEQIVAR